MAIRFTVSVYAGLFCEMALSQPSMAAPLGLYQATQFQTIQGSCQTCQSLPQALWYFRNETFAIPINSAAVTGFDASMRGVEDIQILDRNGLPSLVWTGAHQVWEHARLAENTTQITSQDGASYPLKLVAKIPSNHAYWNAKTVQFFNQRVVTVRGELEDNTLVARTVWPQDYRLDLQAQPQPIQQVESLKSLVQFENGGARSAYQSRLLWEKQPGMASQAEGKAALAIILNGAQGDDDEAHGGHFALATGYVEPQGGYASWLVNNYYNLAANSEKGIIAAVTPLDKYMADLNSGQSYYRPSYMLVAVFSQPDIPTHIQAASNRIYQHFYRNDFVYGHASNNCAGISLDSVRGLGWKVPQRGVESALKASAAYWYVADKEQSLAKGRAAYDYLNTEMTRLLPAVAFDAMGNDLLRMAIEKDNNTLTSKRMLPMAEQIEAIYFVRIPQIPTNRAFGLAPVYSFAQYLTQAPADQGQWKIIPVTPNPLPDRLKNGLALTPETAPIVPIPAVLLLLAALAIVGLLIWLCVRVIGKLINN